MNKKIGSYVLALTAGLIFAFGLVLSGMTQPKIVQGFLNVGAIFAPERFGVWIPNLALVMVGALMVTVFAFYLAPRMRQPWFAVKFDLPNRTDIDFRLIAGAVLFGLGWGLSGYCPGPALASLLLGGLPAVSFTVCMLVGMWLAKKLMK